MSFFGCLALLSAVVSIKSELIPSDLFLDIDGISIAPGTDHVCVIEATNEAPVGGKIRCWGHDDEYGKIYPPQDEYFVQVVSGQFFSCGITIEQRVQCWGSIETGSGTRSGEVAGLFTQLSADRFAVCGVMTDGRISCWGRSEVVKESRALQLDTGHVFVQVSCAESHCCALDDEGHPHCWGVHRKSLGAGQGQGQGQELSSPLSHRVLDMTGVPVEEGDYSSLSVEEVLAENLTVLSSRVSFLQVSVGAEFSCGLRTDDRALQCWGSPRTHKLPVLSRPAVPGLTPSQTEMVVTGPFSQVSVGRVGVCVIHATTGNLSCWGRAADMVPFQSGAEGEEREGSRAERQWDQIAVGHHTVCAVSVQSEAMCWGGASAVVDNIPSELVVS